jgi:hypothetical protein
MDRIKNTVPNFCRSPVDMGISLFAKPLLSDGSCIFAYLAFIAQHWVYMMQNKRTDVSLFHATFYRYVLDIEAVKISVRKRAIWGFVKKL